MLSAYLSLELDGTFPALLSLCFYKVHPPKVDPLHLNTPSLVLYG